MPLDPLYTDILPLKEKISALKEKSFPPGLKNQALFHYHQAVLDILIELFTLEDEEELLAQLKKFLAKNWALVKESFCSYTARPEDELTLVLTEIAGLIHRHQPERPSVISLLMPGVSIQADFKYPDLDTLEVSRLLKTHIIGRGGNYLIPVAQLLDIDEQAERALLNAYFDAFNGMDEALALLSQEEVARLYQHSDVTQALFAAKKVYEASLKEDQSLLYHLDQLCRSLHFNSAHGGIGTGSDAAQGAYPAIIGFNEYYQKIAAKDKALIPQDLRQELELLLELTSNQKSNLHGKTCIGTRHENIQKAMKPHCKILAKIGIDENQKAKHTAEKAKALDEARLRLKQALSPKPLNDPSLEEENREAPPDPSLFENFLKNLFLLSAKFLVFFSSAQSSAPSIYEYKGADALNLTHRLIETVYPEYSIESKEDLQDFMRLSLEEMQTFLQKPELVQSISRQFSSIEELIIFVQESEDQRLIAVLLACWDEISRNAKLRNISDLLANGLENILNLEELEGIDRSDSPLVFAFIDEVRFAAIFRPLLPKLIPNPAYLNIFLNSKWLSLEKKDFIFAEFLKKHAGANLKTIEQYLSIVRFLPRAYVQRFFLSSKEHFPGLIQSLSECHTVLLGLDKKDRHELFLYLRAKLANLPPSLPTYKSIFSSLDETDRHEFYSDLGKNLVNLIKDSAQLSCVDFASLARYLNEEDRHDLYFKLRPRLADLIKNAGDLGALLPYLNETDKHEIYLNFQAQIPNWILNDSQFCEILRFLNAEDGKNLILALGEDLSDLFEDLSSLGKFLTKLNPESKSLILQAFEAKLTSLIRESLVIHDQRYGEYRCEFLDNYLFQVQANFKLILNSLKPNQIRNLLQELKPELYRLIPDHAIFALLEGKNLEETKALLHALKDGLGRSLNYVYAITPWGFQESFATISTEQEPLIIQALASIDWSKSRKGFYRLLAIINAQLSEMTLSHPFSRQAPPMNENHYIHLQNDLAKAAKSLRNEKSQKCLYHAYLQILLEEFKAELINQGKLDALEPLYLDLKNHCEAWYETNNAEPEALEEFKKKSQQSLSLLHQELRAEKSILTFMAEWFLVIASFGTVLLASSLHHGSTTGIWTPRFFDCRGEESLRGIEAVLELEVPVCA